MTVRSSCYNGQEMKAYNLVDRALGNKPHKRPWSRWCRGAQIPGVRSPWRL